MNGPIVVGYAATKRGRDAVACAARIATATGAELVVALILPAEGRSVITPPNPGYERYLHERAETWLAEATAGLPDGVAHTTVVGYADSFAEGLIGIAHDRDAAAIVVGAASSARSGHHRLGSTATELVHSSDVPVVLVPRGARRVDTALPIERVTAAIGTRPGAEALLSAAVGLATRVDAPLRLLSIATVDLPSSVDTGLIRLAGAAHADDVLAAARAELPAGVVAEVVTARGESVEDAVGDVDWTPGDIVLVGSSRLAQPRRLFLGSTATKMLHALPVPVIVVPRTLRDDGATPEHRGHGSSRPNGGAS